MLINLDNFLQEECRPPNELLPWIVYQSSLTDKLKQEAGEANLTLLRQQWDSPDWWDEHVLTLKNDPVMHREILMCAEHEPCWYGRTIIPKQTYESDVTFFARLKKESLGQLIFDNEIIERISLMSYAINPQVIEYHWLTDVMHGHATILWARFSVFMIHKQFSFYLVEILLPGLMRYAN
ncbi:chorismate--pyruvate lyase family protein [Legionella nagasakiensis]|uniref:chorismate--pyruvate lyase family protein n=1 Tax=Legionella nagasakiensis TaxID=535290 RepID=UPI0010546019|nr:chorismate lyase [Legionella nagasakiensis]